jgi:hypothetical protein
MFFPTRLVVRAKEHHMRTLTRFVLFTVLSLVAVSPAQQPSTTAVPNLINYSGTLHLPSSLKSPAKVVGITFAIYRQQDGGASLWLETQNVTPDSTGRYSVMLGSTKVEGISADLFSTQEERWLGVQVEGEAEEPRVLLVSVPYAMKAGDAETVGGLPPSAFVLKPQSSGEANKTITPSSVVAAPALTGQTGGGGTANYIAVWTSNTNLGNSTIYQSGTNVGIGTATPTSTLTVAGSVSGTSVNASTAYQLKGNNILSAPGTQNLFLGQQAGQHNTGSLNTFSGNQAGSSNTTGSENAFFGNQAGQFNVSGRSNTFLGPGAGRNNTSGNDNTFLGARGGLSNTIGNNNVFMGFVAGYNNTTGSQNVFLGNGAGLANTTGQNNTLVGWASGSSNASGTDNTYVGYTSGQHATGSNNIYLGEISSTLSESNTIRIGTTQTAAYMNGIYGNQLSGGLPVVVNSNGQLGTTTQGSSVTSWNGRTGAVTPQSGDYSFSLVGGTLASSQLSGTYSNALALSNTSNVFAGNGSGLTGVLPAGGSQYYIQNGTTQQTGASFNIGGNGTLGGNLAANVVNVAAGYQIGGNNALSTQSNFNLFVGPGAGSQNQSSNYGFNTFVGWYAGTSNITGYYNSFSGVDAGASNINGHENTYYGNEAGYLNITGSYNTFSGAFAGYNNTSYWNTFSGYDAGYSNTTGSGNTFTGYEAGLSNTTGSSNTFEGQGAGASNLNGSSNTFLGPYAGYNNLTGGSNTFVGAGAGNNNLTGNYDIYIGNAGPSSQNESNAIRIGDPSNQRSAYFAGIYNSTSSSGVPVYINSLGQLGTLTSSLRFKEEIRDMGDRSSALMKLRPVTFLYKPEYDKGPRTLQYGLIAEEVAEVYPDLVAYEPDGKPYTVKYQYLTTMLLNEAQKQYRRAEAEAEIITSQEQKIEELEERLSRLEQLVANQERVVAEK